MSKTRIFAIVTVAIMLLAVATNPSKGRLEEAIKEKATDILKQQLKYKDEGAVQLGMTLFGDNIVQDFIQSNIVIDNYYLFSLARVKWQSEETVIGGGAFTKVWLSGKIDEEAEKIIRVLKDL